MRSELRFMNVKSRPRATCRQRRRTVKRGPWMRGASRSASPSCDLLVSRRAPAPYSLARTTSGRTCMKGKILAALAIGALAASAIAVRAANDKFTFPSDFAEGVEYLSVDKPSKQVHVFYAPHAAIAAAKAGQPMPDGTVFTGVHYN